MEAYVLSDGRGVPTSYLHVQINEAAIDWWTAGSNYNDVITQAADEAGGHAFATDSYGPTDLYAGVLFDPARFDEGQLRDAHDSRELAVAAAADARHELDRAVRGHRGQRRDRRRGQRPDRVVLRRLRRARPRVRLPGGHDRSDRPGLRAR